MIPTLSAAFVDENLPDGTHLQPETAFIKHWRMRNIGSVEWNSDTKVLPSTAFVRDAGGKMLRLRLSTPFESGAQGLLVIQW